MRTHPECIPCFVRQALETARLVSDDPSLHERALREVCRLAADWDTGRPPPAMARRIHDLMTDMSGEDDPYREAKSRFNAFILSLLPRLRGMVESSPEPFETALRLAVAGNIIDFGVNGSLTEAEVEEAVEEALHARLDPGVILHLRQALRGASRLLYVGDNAGEVVFDRLFIEEIRRLNPELAITFVTRGGPILNDITSEDALTAGIDRFAAVIDNGDNAPGCIPADCSDGFRQALAGSDLVISKGQGNFETLDELEQEIFFLLRAKCAVIARELGVGLGALNVVRRGRVI